MLINFLLFIEIIKFETKMNNTFNIIFDLERQVDVKSFILLSNRFYSTRTVFKRNEYVHFEISPKKF